MTPEFTQPQVSEYLLKQYGLIGKLTVLDSYCDQNFILTAESGEKFTVKVANSSNSKLELEMQNAAMEQLQQGELAVPHAIPNKQGESITNLIAADSKEYYLRVLTFLPGDFYAESTPESHSEVLWQSLGQFVGAMDSLLQNFNHPGAFRYFDWDLAHGLGICQQKKYLLTAEETKLVDHFLDYYQANTLPLLGKLPRSVIHNDANDYNLIVDNKANPQAITGLIDFGDMVYSHTVNELAITAAYAMMGHDSPEQVLINLGAAYHKQRALNDTEIDVLYSLIALRLCTSVCNAAKAIKEQPDNQYPNCCKIVFLAIGLHWLEHLVLLRLNT